MIKKLRPIEIEDLKGQNRDKKINRKKSILNICIMVAFDFRFKNY